MKKKLMGIILFVPFILLWVAFTLLSKGEDLCRKLAK